MTPQEAWQQAWTPDTHNTEYAEKRIKSAQSAKLTPLSVDRENMSCEIKGSGKLPYHVTLSKCTCGDFIRSNLPCKHIYRLASELGALDVKTDAYESRAYSWDEVLDIVESFSDVVQLELLELIRGARCNEPIVKRRKKSDELQTLISAGLFEVEKETPQFFNIRMKVDYTSGIHKVRQYLNKKYHPPVDEYMDAEGELFEEYKPLTNDDVAARLIEKGYAVSTPDGIFIKSTLS